MEKGELGTETQKRILFIWEGAVARLPEKLVVRDLERIKRRMGLFDAAVGYWVISDLAIRWMWSILSRTDLRVDLAVTTRQPEFAMAVARLVERNNWPIRYVFCETPQNLGRMLPSMPDVERVYYGLEEQRWAYGPQGMWFQPDAGQIV